MPEEEEEKCEICQRPEARVHHTLIRNDDGSFDGILVDNGPVACHCTPAEKAIWKKLLEIEEAVKNNLNYLPVLPITLAHSDTCDHDYVKNDTSVFGDWRCRKCGDVR